MAGLLPGMASVGVNKVLMPNTFMADPRPVGTPGSAHFDTFSNVLGQSASDFIEHVKGTEVNRAMTTHGSLMQHSGVPRSTTSLYTAVSGTAHVMSQACAMDYAMRSDPIKIIAAPMMLTEEKLIVLKPVGYSAPIELVPERAAARTMATSEIAREYDMARYGIDIPANLNFAHDPTSFYKDLFLKMDMVNYAVNNKHIELAYDEILTNATSLIQAYLRNDSIHGVKTGRARTLAADRIRKRLFCCSDRDDNPVATIANALAQAGLVVPVGGGPHNAAVLMVPQGFGTTSVTEHNSSLGFYSTGLPNNSSVSVPLEDARRIPGLNVDIVTHNPYLSDTTYGSENPQVEKSELDQIETISLCYPFTPTEKFAITDFKTCQYKDFEFNANQCETRIDLAVATEPGLQKFRSNLTNGTCEALVIENFFKDPGHKYTFRNATPFTDDEEIEYFLYRPALLLNTQSLLYCSKPGKRTAVMMWAYPHIGVGIDRVTEAMTITYRIYLGAALISPENVMIVPSVIANGFVSGHGTELAASSIEYTLATSNGEYEEGHDLVMMAKLKRTPFTDLFNDPVFVALNYTGGPAYDVIHQKIQAEANGGIYTDEQTYTDQENGDPSGSLRGLPVIPSIGRVVDKDRKQLWKNTCGFGDLDNPNYCERLDGVKSASSILRIRNV